MERNKSSSTYEWGKREKEGEGYLLTYIKLFRLTLFIYLFIFVVAFVRFLVALTVWWMPFLSLSFCVRRCRCFCFAFSILSNFAFSKSLSSSLLPSLPSPWLSVYFMLFFVCTDPLVRAREVQCYTLFIKPDTGREVSIHICIDRHLYRRLWYWYEGVGPKSGGAGERERKNGTEAEFLTANVVREEGGIVVAVLSLYRRQFHAAYAYESTPSSLSSSTLYGGGREAVVFQSASARVGAAVPLSFFFSFFFPFLNCYSLYHFNYCSYESNIYSEDIRRYVDAKRIYFTFIYKSFLFFI